MVGVAGAMRLQHRIDEKPSIGLASPHPTVCRPEGYLPGVDPRPANPLNTICQSARCNCFPDNIGRALPVVVLAPLADHPVGIRCTELMAERPSLYRRARLGDAAALAIAAAALVVTAPGANAAHAS